MHRNPRRARRRPSPTRMLALGLSSLLLGGCGLFLIDSDARSAEFCERNAELLEVGRFDEPGSTYNEAQSTFFSEEYSKTMRYAEDGTRELRRAARDLEDAYDDVRDMVHDDDVPAEEEEEKFGRLREERAEVREICQEYLPEGGTGETATSDDDDSTDENSGDDAAEDGDTADDTADGDTDDDDTADGDTGDDGAEDVGDPDEGDEE